MTLITTYKAEAAKYALLAKGVEVENMTKELREATNIAGQISAERKAAQITAESELKKVEDLKAAIEPLITCLQKLQAEHEAACQAASTSGLPNDIIIAKKLKQEVNSTESEKIGKEIIIFEQSNQVNIAQTDALELDTKLTSAEKLRDELVQKLELLKEDYEVSKKNFQKTWPDTRIEGFPVDMQKLLVTTSVEQSTPRQLRQKLLNVQQADENIPPNVAKLSRNDPDDPRNFEKVESDLHVALLAQHTLQKELNAALLTIEQNKAELEGKGIAQLRLSNQLNRVNVRLNDKIKSADAVQKELEGKLLAATMTINKRSSFIDEQYATIENLTTDKEHLVANLRELDTKIQTLSEQLTDAKRENEEVTKRLEDDAAKTPITTYVLPHERDIDFAAKYRVELMVSEAEKNKNAELTEMIAMLSAELKEKTLVATNAETKKLMETEESANGEVQNLMNALENLTKEKDDLMRKLGEAQSLAVKQLDNPVKLSTETYPHNLENGQPGPQDTTTSVDAQVASLKAKIEQMTPLYKVGNHVRSRKLEICLPKPSQNRKIIDAGWDMVHNGAALADATLSMDFAIDPYHAANDYSKRYGVPAAFVWENRHFTKLLEVLDMKMTINTEYRKFSSCCPHFNQEVNKFLPRIIQNLEFKNDEQLDNDLAMKQLFDNLKNIYVEACNKFDQDRVRKFSK